MTNQNLTIEKNMTAYNIVIGTYTEKHHGIERAFFVWARNGVTGEMVSWEKGSDLHINNLSYRAANINRADMTGIITGIKSLFPDLIGSVDIPDEYKSYA